jgi:hypothetical protein
MHVLQTQANGGYQKPLFFLCVKIYSVFHTRKSVFILVASAYHIAYICDYA